MKHTIYGYCRVSTGKQKIDRQIKNIKDAYPDAVIIEEVYTGTTTARPKWEGLQKRLKEGDTVVFDEVSRMSRNAAEGVETYDRLYNAGVNLVFLKEPHINTDVYKAAKNNRVDLTEAVTGRESIDEALTGLQDWVNGLLMGLAREQIKIAFDSAQSEVEHLQRRTSEGIKRAQAAGKRIGREGGTTIDTKKAQKCRHRIRELSKDFNGNLKDVDIIKILGVTKNSYYKYKKQVAEGLE